MTVDAAQPWGPRLLARIGRPAAVVFTAAMLASAFPPFSSSEAAWVGLVPLLILARHTPVLSAFRWGMAAGAGFWLANLAWMLALGRTGCPVPLAVLAWVTLAAYASLYVGAFTAVASEAFRLTAGTPAKPTEGQWVAGEPQVWSERLRRLLLIPGLAVLWVGFEWLRSNLLVGFPWNQLGVSQYRNLAVIQLAEWGGVYAVTALLVIVNVAITLTVLRMVDLWVARQGTRFQVELAVGLAAMAFVIVAGGRMARLQVRVERQSAHVRLTGVQPGIPQMKKWEEGAVEIVVEALARQSLLAAVGKPDLMIWPETAIPVMAGSEAEWLPYVTPYATNGVPVLAGVVEYEIRPSDGGLLCYNSAVLVDTNGVVAGRYRKQHLVPFGEYIPLERWIPLLKRLAPMGFSCEPGREATVFRLPAVAATFASLICFEDAVPHLAARAVRCGAAFLVNQTNDAWFDGTAAPVQHMAHCVFRCVENRVGAVRVANTGVTCYIDRTGAIQDVRALSLGGWGMGTAGFKSSVLAVRDPDEDRTVYTRMGDWPFAMPAGVLAAAAAAVVGIRTRRRRGGSGAETGAGVSA
jgi:apolipoprotein N-acyltransferase